MPFEVYFDTIDDIRRLADQPQQIYIQFHSKILREPIRTQQLDSGFSKFNLQYAFKLQFISDDPLYVTMRSLHPSTYKEVLGEGVIYLDQLYKKKRSNSQQLKIRSVAKGEIIISGKYAREAILHIIVKHFDKKGETQPYGICKPIQYYGKLEQDRFTHHLKIEQKNKKEGKVWENGLSKSSENPNLPHGRAFFTGSCETKNLFSLMDSGSKGQYYTMFQKQIPK